VLDRDLHATFSFLTVNNCWLIVEASAGTVGGRREGDAMRHTHERVARASEPLSMTPLMLGYLVLAVLTAVAVRLVG
jgi:hypothetical protein